MATAAIAASAALPPARSTSSAVNVAIGAEVAAIPFAAIAAERPGILKSRIALSLPKCKAPAGAAMLIGGLIACSGLMHGLTLGVNSRPGNKTDHGWKFRPAALSGCQPAHAGRDRADCARSAVVADAAALCARSHQSVADRRRRRLDDRRYRLRDAREQGVVGADLYRAAR